MTVVTQRVQFPTWPRWVMIAGVALALIGLVGGVLSIGPGALRPGLIDKIGAEPLSFLVFVLVAVLGAFIFVVGMVAYVVVGSLSHELAEHSYNGIGTILACFGVGVVIGNLVALVALIVDKNAIVLSDGAFTPGGLVLSLIAQDGGILGVLYLRIARPGVLSWKQMGLDTDRLSQLLVDGVGYGVVTIVGSELVGLLLQSLGVVQTQQAMFRGLLNAPPLQFLAVVLAAAVFAPVVEEIFFRGYILTGLAKRWGTPAAFLVSTLLFALAHGDPRAFLPLFYAGLVLAYARWRSGSLVPGMVAHFMNNAIAFLALYLFGAQI